MLFANTFVFDIETVPDISGARKLYPEISTLDDSAVADFLFAKRRQEVGNDFLRHHLQKIVAISIVFRSTKQLKVWSVGEEDSSEQELIQRFYSGMEKFTPTLVSWNGAGFDLPVLHYRALVNGVQAPTYWETGGNDNQFKWNNYLNRYHQRHLDLMDVLAGYQMKSAAPLTEIATLLGFPGKMGMDGSKVWSAFHSSDIKSIRDYCETDVLNTYLVYLQFEYMRGNVTDKALKEEHALIKQTLIESEQTHFQSFLEAWENV